MQRVLLQHRRAAAGVTGDIRDCLGGARGAARDYGAGIHGTDETWSIGQAVSHGCVRMTIPDVEDLYDRVDVGTPIYIG